MSLPSHALHPSTGERVLRLGVAFYAIALVALPLLVIVHVAFADGAAAFWEHVTNPIAVSALWLTVWTALLVAVLNVFLGTATAWVLVRYPLPGRALLSALVDLPLAIPTLVAGVMLAILYGPTSVAGQRFEAWGFEVIFAPPGIVIALLFVTLPFVVRAVEPVLADQARLQFCLERVQVQHIRGGIILLRVAQLRSAPVRALLLFGDFDPQQLADQILEAVTICIGAHQLAGDLGAKHRGRVDPHVMPDRGEIEAREVEELQHVRVGQHALQVRRVIGGAIKLHEVRLGAAVGDLHEAERIADQREAQRLAIDGNWAVETDAIGQIALVQIDRDVLAIDGQREFPCHGARA